MTEEAIEQKLAHVVVDDEGNVIEVAQTEQPAAPEEDERNVKAEEEDQGDHGDEQGEEGETEEEAEARRERNRQRRRENKERRKDYVESLKREIAARDELLQQAMQRLDRVERRTHGADIAAVDAELQKSNEAYNYFKMQHAEAVSASDGQRAVEAQERMMQAAERFKQLQGIKQAAQRPQTPAPQPLDPRLKMHAEEWLGRNEWYDPQGGDMDSKVALSIDQQMAAEGWNPTTEQYWNELDARLKKYLPHRYNSGYNRPQGGGKPRAPVSGSGRESAAQGKGYSLSPERVQAIKDAGQWDDPAERAKAIKAYINYDKQQGAR